MKYETIPTEVEVIEFAVDGGIVGAGGKMIPARKGQFGVRWPGSGIAEVLSPDDFHKKYRIPPPPYVGFRMNDPDIRQIEVTRESAEDFLRRSQPRTTFADPVPPIGPTCSTK